MQQRGYFVNKTQLSRRAGSYLTTCSKSRFPLQYLLH